MRVRTRLSLFPVKRTIRPISPHARQLRADSTDAERAIWNAVRGRRLGGFKFKQQWTIGPFVVDFRCWERRLVVEIDGGQHGEKRDRRSMEWLEAQGYRVVRFWNNDVITNLEGVLQVLHNALTSHPHPGPLPRAGVGG